jgi:hypothetical protein
MISSRFRFNCRPSRLTVAAIWTGSPSKVRSTISWLRRRPAARRMRSSWPSGSTMRLRWLLAHFTSWYWNIWGVMPSGLYIFIFCSSAGTSIYCSKASRAWRIFLVLSGVMRLWMLLIWALVWKVPVLTARMGTTVCRPSISRITGSSGSLPAVSTMPATRG